MQSILQQEYHICKAEASCTTYKIYNGTLHLMRTGQRLSQARSVHFPLHLVQHSTVRSDWLFLVQAKAQHQHLMIVQQAIQHQVMPVVHSDPAGSDHQHVHNSEAMVHEHELNKKMMKDLEKKIQVCAVAVRLTFELLPIVNIQPSKYQLRPVQSNSRN